MHPGGVCGRGQPGAGQPGLGAGVAADDRAARVAAQQRRFSGEIRDFETLAASSLSPALLLVRG